VTELGHALFGVSESHRASDVVANWEVWVFSEFGVQLGCVLLYLHDAPRARVSRDVAGCVPGRTRGQFVTLEQQHIGATHLG
jgi:hypothetical protein